MTRDRSARTRIREYLVTHSAVEDPAGYATNILKEATGYQGKAVAFIQLVAAMDRDGEIVREIRGKRTYRIALGAVESASLSSPTAAASLTAPAPPLTLDYDRLARSLLRQFIAQAVQDEAPQDSLDQLHAEHSRYATRLELARLRLADLLGDQGPSPTDSMTVGSERFNRR